MATTPADDDFDMPDLTDEMLLEFKPLTELAHTDLHMDAVQVKSIGKPKVEPFDLSGTVTNVMISTMCLCAAWMFVQVWIWVLSS